MAENKTISARELEQIAGSLAAFPAVLEALLQAYHRPILQAKDSADDWSILETIGHLVVVERPAFRERIAAIVAGVDEIPAIDTAAVFRESRFNQMALDDLLGQFKQERRVSAEFVRRLDSAELSRSASYKAHGHFRAADFVLEWPYHDHDHLQQILMKTKGSYLPQMSETMRRALG